MKAFIQQYNLRVDNQIKLLFELRNGPLSLNDLASRINVSFTAIVKIVQQLKDEGVLVFTKKQKSNKKGRKPSFVKINTKVGVTCAIDLSGFNITIALSDLRNRILVQKTIPSDIFITEKNLDSVLQTINELLNDPIIENRKLLSICIAAPGLINKNTGEFAASYRLRLLEKFSISNYFFNRLGVPTYIYNDVKIGMVGEKMFGCIPLSAQNYMFVHIGNGCSVSLAFDGKLYQGTHGYSGELSSYSSNVDFDIKITNNHLEDLFQIAKRANAKCPELNLLTSERTADLDKLFDLINQNNQIILDEISFNARCNAAQLIAYNDILDLEYIVVSGSILKIGNMYKESLLKSISELNGAPIRAKILFSQLENTALLGSMYQANNLYFLKKLEDITNEKSSTAQYDISEAFGSNI